MTQNCNFQAFGSTYDLLADWAYVLVRITAGLMLLPHVWPKLVTAGAAGVAAGLARRGIEPALPFAYLIMFLELVGGICIAIGFLTRPFALLCLIEMIVIIFQSTFAKRLGLQRAGRWRRISSHVGNPVPGDPHSWRWAFLG